MDEEKKLERKEEISEALDKISSQEHAQILLNKYSSRLKEVKAILDKTKTEDEKISFAEYIDYCECVMDEICEKYPLVIRDTTNKEED
ncbi:MAG: hypothetical protein PHC46_04335 [Clostridia bacterium]|nr:hypothetical protein [Clostridia bacterium]